MEAPKELVKENSCNLNEHPAKFREVNIAMLYTCMSKYCNAIYRMYKKSRPLNLKFKLASTNLTAMNASN